MNSQTILSKLAAILGRERSAIKVGDLEELLSLSSQKAELMISLETAGPRIPTSNEKLARQVQRGAYVNCFLLERLEETLKQASLESESESRSRPQRSPSIDHLEPAFDR